MMVLTFQRLRRRRRKAAVVPVAMLHNQFVRDNHDSIFY
jgi:hypothetical protein